MLRPPERFRHLVEKRENFSFGMGAGSFLFLIYLRLEPYLHRWLTHSLGNPVTFPAKSNENAIIRRFLQIKPTDAIPDWYAEGLTAICIPDCKAMPVLFYNYCPPKGKAAIIEAIEELFRELLFVSYGTKRADCGLNQMIASWREAHGIDDDYVGQCDRNIIGCARRMPKMGCSWEIAEKSVG